MTSSEDPSDLRGALLRAARAELARAGRASSSQRAVARRAGVSHAAPGYAFGDRTSLQTAVAVQGFRELAAVMDQPPVPAGGRAWPSWVAGTCASPTPTPPCTR